MYSLHAWNVGCFHYGLIHKPIYVQEALKVPEANVAVDEDGEELQNPTLKSSVRRRKMEQQSTSRTWWTSVTWRTPNLQNTSRSTYNGRVVLRGDNVKDEEGCKAVFAEQSASASQMAAAGFLDTILINYINQTKVYRQFSRVGSRLKIAILVYSRTLHLQVTCEIQNQCQKVYCAYLDHTRLFHVGGCARSKPQFLTSMQSLKIFARRKFTYGWITSSSVWSVCLGNIIQQANQGKPWASHSWMSHSVSFTCWQMCFWVNWRPRTALRELQAMYHVMPLPENADQTWGQYARGIFLQGCCISRKRRKTSCKLILRLKSWENKGFVRRTVLSTDHCRKYTMQKFTSSLMYGRRSDERTRIQVHHKMEWLSRAIQRIGKKNWWWKDSGRIPHIFGAKTRKKRKKKKRGP